jgi:hypothetical protein
VLFRYLLLEEAVVVAVRLLLLTKKDPLEAVEEVK